MAQDSRIATTHYVINTRVKRVEERVERFNWHRDADGQSTCDTRSIGWWVVLEGSWEGLYLGNERPTLAVGDAVRVTLERR
jgi:hypothetical protein